MKLISYTYEKTCLIERSELDSIIRELNPEIKRLQQALNMGYTTDYASINVPSDYNYLQTVHTAIEAKKKLKPTALVLIGIGGSNLGTLAIHEAIHGKLYNELSSIKLYCADTVDSDALTQQLSLVEAELQRGNNIILNVVTKSGTTTETIANFELFLALLQKYKPSDFHEYVVVTTDVGSAFNAYAREQQFTVLDVPHKVGGRYSVFTAVGLFPLGLLNIDIDALVKGAHSIISLCVDERIEHNIAAMNALIKYAHYQQCVNINDFFVFAISLSSVGLWYRQLLAESIGKEFNKNNQRVEVGITPTVSIGSVDLHSVGQLYLGGPRDKFTTFVTVGHHATTLSIPQMPAINQFVESIQGKKVASIMHAILQGVQTAYLINKRPFCTISLSSIDEYSLGQLMQMYMIEVMYLGYLFDVNPFDQPNVESYKRETRKILAT